VLRKTIFAGAAALTLGATMLAPSDASAWWYGQPGWHGWHGLPHGSHAGWTRQPATRFWALPFAATPAPTHIWAEPVPATPIAPPRVAAVPPPPAPVAAPPVPAAPVPVAPWYGPCGCLHVSHVFHRELRTTYGLSFDPRNFDQTEPHYYFGAIRAYPRYWVDAGWAQ
jgi:hypothetical protein